MADDIFIIPRREAVKATSLKDFLKKAKVDVRIGDRMILRAITLEEMRRKLEGDK